MSEFNKYAEVADLFKLVKAILLVSIFVRFGANVF